MIPKYKVAYRVNKPHCTKVNYLQREVFCKTCYTDNFDTRSKSVGPGDTSTIREANLLLNCPRCGGAVFEAEKVVSRS